MPESEGVHVSKIAEGHFFFFGKVVIFVVDLHEHGAAREVLAACRAAHRVHLMACVCIP